MTYLIKFIPKLFLIIIPYRTHKNDYSYFSMQSIIVKSKSATIVYNIYLYDFLSDKSNAN